MTDFVIPQPPVDLFENIAAKEQILSESKLSWKIDGMNYTKGVFIHVEGAPFPKKGFPTPEAIWAINLVKRTFIEAVKICSLPQFYIVGAIFVLFPKKHALNRILDSFNRLSWGALSPYIMRNEYLTPIAQELIKTIYTFLVDLGLSHDKALQTSKIFSHLIEYDSAYRYRIEDILTETSKEEILNNPRKEINRIITLLEQRDTEHVGPKFRKVANILMFLLLSPRIKRAFTRALKESEFKNFQLDEADWYWCCLREDYKFFGLTLPQRHELLKERGLSIPNVYKINE